MEKTKLNKYESAIVFIIKNHKLKKEYTFDKYDFLKTTEEVILNDYEDVYLTYAEIVMVEPKYLELKAINNYLIDILYKMDRERLITTLKGIQNHRYVVSTGYGMNKELILKYSPTQALFFELVSGIRCLEMRKNNNMECIYELDKSLIEEKK